MNSDLNLLPSQAKFQAAKIRLKKLLLNLVWIFSGVWVALVLIILIIFLIRQTTLNQLEKKLKSDQNQYMTLSGDAILSYQIKYQAKLVGKVLTDRFEYGSSIKMIKGLFPEGVELSDFKIPALKQFTLSGKITDGKNMDKVEDLVRSINDNEVEGLKSASLKSVGVDNTGGWVFVMEVILK